MTTSYSGNPADSPKDAVRFWISDKGPTNWQFADEEILYVLTQFSNPMLAAANCARELAAKFSVKPNKRVGDLAISWGDVAKAYRELAASLQAQGNTFNLRVYSGGTSWSDRFKVIADTDRVAPPFVIDQFNNPSGVNNTSEEGWDTAPVQ